MLGGSRISHQLRDYNPHQLGIYASCNTHHNVYNRTRPPAPPPCIFPLASSCTTSSSDRFFRFKMLSTNPSSSSSSSLTNNNDDLSRVSFLNNDGCVQNAAHTPILYDCLSPAENGRDPPSERISPVSGGIVALGKFDALHIGHRELAIQAARIGVPFLLSFIGMAEILGWEPRAPIVAKCDRKRVLSSWAPLCGNVIPKEFQVEFSKVRYLTPQKFVEKLAEELGVRGVVAGQNYRFGYKAAGDASDLVRLCKEYGMRACIIDSVMDKNQGSGDIDIINSKEQGQVSSTRVRYALANGDMKYVSELLGRPHRLMLEGGDNKEKFSVGRKRISAPKSCLLNLPPKEGLYQNCSLLIGDGNVFSCRVIIDTTDIHLDLDELDPRMNFIAQNFELLSIDFVESVI